MTLISPGTMSGSRATTLMPRLVAAWIGDCLGAGTVTCAMSSFGTRIFMGPIETS